MAEVEEEVRQERERRGDDIDEEEVTRRMHARFRDRGTSDYNFTMVIFMRQQI